MFYPITISIFFVLHLLTKQRFIFLSISRLFSCRCSHMAAAQYNHSLLLLATEQRQQTEVKCLAQSHLKKLLVEVCVVHTTHPHFFSRDLNWWPIIQKWASLFMRLLLPTYFWIQSIENILKKRTAVVVIIHQFDIEWPKMSLIILLLTMNFKPKIWTKAHNKCVVDFNRLTEKCSISLKKCIDVCFCACRSLVAA